MWLWWCQAQPKHTDKQKYFQNKKALAVHGRGFFMLLAFRKKQPFVD
jgi:hypothetical protein